MSRLGIDFNNILDEDEPIEEEPKLGKAPDTDIDESDEERIKKTAKLSIVIGVIVVFICLVVLMPLSKRLRKGNTQKATQEVTQEIQDTGKADSSSTEDTQIEQSVPEQSDGWTKLDSLINCKTEKYGKLKITRVGYYAKMTGDKVQIKGVATGKLDGSSGLFEVEIPNQKLSTVSVGKTVSVKYRQGVQGSTEVICDISFL